MILKELEQKIKINYCKDQPCFGGCSFPKQDCPQVKVFLADEISLLADSGLGWQENRYEKGGCIPRFIPIKKEVE